MDSKQEIWIYEMGIGIGLHFNIWSENNNTNKHFVNRQNQYISQYLSVLGPPTTSKCQHFEALTLHFEVTE